MKRFVPLALAGTLCCGPALAEAPRFTNLFGDHAVLQRGQPVRLGGRADPGAALSVQIAGQSLATTTDANGRWAVTTRPMDAGGPYTLSVSDGRARTVLSDVMVGEVWFCSGQSNMGLKLQDATNGGNEVRDSENPLLRFTDVGRDVAPRPLDEAKAVSGWTLAAPASVGTASAACYFMAKALQAHFGVTVGFITSTWGGTQTQAWIGEAGLHPLNTYDDALDRLDLYARDPQAGEARQARYFDAWWTAHEPDAKTKAAWARPDFDDAGWNPVHPNRVWERIGDPQLASFNGAVWYRTAFTLTKAQADGATRIALGLIDDSDTIAPADHRKTVLVDAFSESLKRIGGYRYVAEKTVFRPTMDRPLYSLVFGTRNPPGLEVFRNSQIKALRKQEEARGVAKLNAAVASSKQGEMWDSLSGLAPDPTVAFLSSEEQAAKLALLAAIPQTPGTAPWRAVWPEVMERHVVSRATINQLANVMRKQGVLAFDRWGPKQRSPDDDNRVSRSLKL
ncbi:hypothetical protein [Caulobacter sp. RL271]|jgi:hypothetical protein|uniref:Uncharacterized protein n=1 Tax=Caulobacter segnis TaxID=88688 RepID=A0ABY4ZT21_9CAUL|nr:hypothetical protein [Caulobacter segnis]USQ95868.1 hypothetical protein MZV50_25580 [Caulobacter segnis]